jgi:hypothetical protein
MQVGVQLMENQSLRSAAKCAMVESGCIRIGEEEKMGERERPIRYAFYCFYYWKEQVLFIFIWQLNQVIFSTSWDPATAVGFSHRTHFLKLRHNSVLMIPRKTRFVITSTI